MSLSFTAVLGKPDEKRRRNRTRAVQVRRTLEDVTQREFDDAINRLLERNFIRDQNVLAELSERRDQIPFVEKRMNQTYLAGALVLWYQLSRPTYKKLLKIDGQTYQKAAVPILLTITEIKEKSLNESTIQPEESTLFRYVSEIAFNLEFVDSIRK